MKTRYSRKKGTIALYGSIGLKKSYCSQCKSDSFVIDGILQCCDKEIEKFDTCRIKREILGESKRRRIPKYVKERILHDQNNCCLYCNRLFGSRLNNIKTGKNVTLKIHFDHVIPWSYSRATKAEELVAACHICNLLKSSDYFDDIDSIKVELRKRRISHGWDNIYTN